MRVGVIGLGKVGLAWAYVLRHHGGHQVIGHDIQVEIPLQLQEPGMAVLHGRGPILTAPTVGDVLDRAEVVFVAVQTPHAPGYGGDQPMPLETRDFDYTHLIAAVREVGEQAKQRGWTGTVVVMSTVLPGTCRRELLPLLPPGVGFAYSPAFISLGRIVRDLLGPQLILIGQDTGQRPSWIHELYAPLGMAGTDVAYCDIESAELAKMAHNCWTSQKIGFVNILAEVADTAGANIDQVTRVLASTGDYIPRAGMGDGGACRPRDAIAMQWLAEESTGVGPINFFQQLTATREDHSRWLAQIVADQARSLLLPVAILGRSYKPGVPYIDGSPSTLLIAHLEELGVLISDWWDPYSGGDTPVTLPTDRPFIAVIATDHPEFIQLVLPYGSVVIDPWGRQPERDGVTLITPGRTR